MQRHFVSFYSPGTIFSESTSLPIDEWDIITAWDMANEIVERHNATPYAFQFKTFEREDDELNSRLVESSKTFHMGGRLLNIEQVEAENDDKGCYDILLRNMRGNRMEYVIINDNSWRSVLEFNYKKDVLLDPNTV